MHGQALATLTDAKTIEPLQTNPSNLGRPLHAFSGEAIANGDDSGNPLTYGALQITTEKPTTQNFVEEIIYDWIPVIELSKENIIPELPPLGEGLIHQILVSRGINSSFKLRILS